MDDLGGDGVDLLVERLVREGGGAVPLDQRRHALPVRLLLVAARLSKFREILISNKGREI